MELLMEVRAQGPGLHAHLRVSRQEVRNPDATNVVLIEGGQRWLLDPKSAPGGIRTPDLL
jgi:hypothetical protein